MTTVRLPVPTTALSRVCEIILGQSPPGSAYNESGVGEPFFQGKTEFGDLYPTPVKWTTTGNKRARPGDVLLSVRAPVGPTNLAPFDCVIGRGLAALRPSSDLETRYLLWAMRFTASALRDRASGSTFEAVTGEQIRTHKIPYFPLPEQRRIVAAIERLFSHLDAAEKFRESSWARARSWRRLLVEATWRDEWPSYELREKVTDTLLGLDRGRARQNKASIGHGYVKMGDVNVDGRVTLDDLVFVDASPVETERYALSNGDLLFNTRNSRELVGKTGIVRDPPHGVLFNNNLLRMRLDPTVRPAFLCYQLQTRSVQRQFDRIKSGTTNVAAIYQRDLMGTMIRVPDLSTQDRLLNELDIVLAVADRLLGTIARAESRLDALRASILASAFFGRLIGAEAVQKTDDHSLVGVKDRRLDKPRRLNAKIP